MAPFHMKTRVCLKYPLNDCSPVSRPVPTQRITPRTYKDAPAQPDTPCPHSHSIAFIAFNAKGATVAQGKKSPLIVFL